MGQTEKPILLVKYGGNAMTDEELKVKVLRNIVALREHGYDIVIVHGGGPFIRQALEEARIESEFIDGHRKTTSEAFTYVEMALKGKVNGSLVNIINSLGHKAVGLSGKDGMTVIASKRMHKKMIGGRMTEVDLGQVGDVATVDPSLIRLLLSNGYIPVITCIAQDQAGNGYNINADMFAGHIAGSLGAEQYIVLTDVDGLLRDKNDPSTLISVVSPEEISRLREKNIIQGGMIPKIESCAIAIGKGASAARIINGTVPSQILSLVSDHPSGTMIKK